MAVKTDGKREIVGLHIGPSEVETFWSTFLKSLVRRGLSGAKLVISVVHFLECSGNSLSEFTKLAANVQTGIGVRLPCRLQRKRKGSPCDGLEREREAFPVRRKEFLPMKTTTIRKIALGQLALSPKNVRKTKPSAADDAALEASIAAHGLKQNLGVEVGAQDATKGDRFFVHAGGRRLKALQALCAKGVIDAAYKVPCVIDDTDDAAEISLAENVVRAAMHPADEFEAFAALIGEGATEEEVAGRFGITVTHIRKRMKLALVAPEILDRYRNETITLETLMAFTLTDSHNRQREVFAAIEPNLGYGGSPAHLVRRQLTETRVSGNSRLARFVGVEAYEAAGGKLTRDLFSDEKGAQSVWFDDPGLLETLALVRLEDDAETLRLSWKWVDVMLDMPWQAAQAFGRVYPEPVDADPAVDEEMSQVDARLSELSDTSELSDAETEEYERLVVRAEALEDQLDQLEQTYSDEAMAIAGGLLSLDHSGEIRFEAGLVRPEDIPSEAPADTPTKRSSGTVDASDAGGSEDAHDCGKNSSEDNVDGGDDDDVAAPAADSPKSLRIDAPRAVAMRYAGQSQSVDDAATARRKEMGLSAALADDLRAIRHQILKAHLAGDFEIAFDLNLYSLCTSVFAVGCRLRPVDLSVTPAMNQSSAAHLTGTVAEKMLETQKKALRLDWMQLPKPEDFTALSALKPREKQALFAFATACGLVPQLSLDHGANPVIEEAGRRMTVDVAACWRPTAASYFSRVKKEMSLDVARERIGDRWADEHRGDKKAVLAEAMEAAFSEWARERTGLTPAAVEKTTRWLPAGMGFGDADAAMEGADGATIDVGESGDADNAKADGVEDADLNDDAIGDADEADEAEEADGAEETADAVPLPAFLTADVA